MITKFFTLQLLHLINDLDHKSLTFNLSILQRDFKEVKYVFHIHYTFQMLGQKKNAAKTRKTATEAIQKTNLHYKTITTFAII